MSNIEFEEPRNIRRDYGIQNNPKMVQWLLDKNIAKDTQQATYVLIGIAILAIILTIIIITSGGATDDSDYDPTIQPEDILFEQQ